VNVCEELRQIAFDDVTVFSRVSTGDPETKQQSNWKSPNSLRLKRARQVKSKVRSMPISFFTLKGIVHKEMILAGQTVSSNYYDCVKIWEDLTTSLFKIVSMGLYTVIP
jgi:hypothetical protein